MINSRHAKSILDRSICPIRNHKSQHLEINFSRGDMQWCLARLIRAVYIRAREHQYFDENFGAA